MTYINLAYNPKSDAHAVWCQEHLQGKIQGAGPFTFRISVFKLFSWVVIKYLWMNWANYSEHVLVLTGIPSDGSRRGNLSLCVPSERNKRHRQATEANFQDATKKCNSFSRTVFTTRMFLYKFCNSLLKN